MKSILIIGGNSYIAKHFLNSYKDKYNITTVSRSDNGYVKNVIVQDYWDINPELLRAQDVIINCAAIVHKQKRKKSDAEYMKINCDLPVYIAGLAKTAGVDLFIQMSTMSVYGNDELIDLTTKPNPLTPYGKSKLAADIKLQDMMKDTCLKVALLRFPMVYGPGAPGNIRSLSKLIATGIPLPFKNIKNKRSFTNIDNLVNYIDAIISNKANGLLLVGDYPPISTTELVMLIAKNMGKNNILFPMPRWILFVLNKVLYSIINKMYGTCVVDSAPTFVKLGINKIISYEEGIKNMIHANLK